MLLDTENWQRVITYLEDGDNEAGLLRLIEKRSGYLFAKKAREEFALNPIYTRRVFPSFHAEGNPFNATNSSGWLSLENGIRFQYETRPIPAAKRGDAGEEGGGDHDPNAGNEDNQSSPVADEPELVLNASTLSGYIRCVFARACLCVDLSARPCLICASRCPCVSVSAVSVVYT